VARVVCLAGLGNAAAAGREAEAIFWESAATQSFAGQAARAAYRDLWFGRYLDQCASALFIALGSAGEVRGYLAGSMISNASPLPGPDYYRLFSGALLAAYPAHLHVNVKAGWRNAGVGGELVRAFTRHCEAQGSPGLHAVTRAGSPAAAFFTKCGLEPLASAHWHGHDIAFLGRQLNV